MATGLHLVSRWLDVNGELTSACFLSAFGTPFKRATEAFLRGRSLLGRSIERTTRRAALSSER
jgi:hypothetical protein